MGVIFPDLRFILDDFTHPDGRQQSLLRLNGTVPITYKGLNPRTREEELVCCGAFGKAQEEHFFSIGGNYNIPVCIWIPGEHPVLPPMAFVVPTVVRCCLGVAVVGRAEISQLFRAKL